MYLVWISKYCIELYDQQKSHIQSKKNSRARYARAFSGVISAFINLNIDFENRKLGNLTSKHQI